MSAHEQTPLSKDTIDSVVRHREVGRAKDLSAPPRRRSHLSLCSLSRTTYQTYMHTRNLLLDAYACNEICYVSSVIVCASTLIALVLNEHVKSVIGVSSYKDSGRPM